MPGFHHSIGPGALLFLLFLLFWTPIAALARSINLKNSKGVGLPIPIRLWRRADIGDPTTVSRADRKRSCHSAEYPYDVVSQRWQVLLHHGPHGIEVNAEVGVDKAIARSCDLPPGTGGLACRQVSTQVLDRLADDFELTDHRTLGLAVCHEDTLALLREARDRIDGAQYISQEQPVPILYKDRASASTRALMSG